MILALAALGALRSYGVFASGASEGSEIFDSSRPREGSERRHGGPAAARQSRVARLAAPFSRRSAVRSIRLLAVARLTAPPFAACSFRGTPVPRSALGRRWRRLPLPPPGHSRLAPVTLLVPVALLPPLRRRAAWLNPRRVAGGTATPSCPVRVVVLPGTGFALPIL